MISRAKSEALFAEALNYIPGGVNSPVRAFRAVGGKPFFVNRASGCRVTDWDGNNSLITSARGAGNSRARASENHFCRQGRRRSRHELRHSKIPPRSRWQK